MMAAALIPRSLRNWVHRVLLRDWRRRAVDRHFLSVTSRREILGGPFRGMMYSEKSVCSAYYPKLLGTYEKELHTIINGLPSRGYDTFVNVGAAEGYYAAGVARLGMRNVIAFEAVDPSPLLATLRLNGLEARVVVSGACDIPALSSALEAARAPMVWMDVEGAEFLLLDPRVCAGLLRADILVEIHERSMPFLRSALHERFKATHSVQHIAAEKRSLSDLPFRLPAWPFDASVYVNSYLDERRSDGYSWMYLTIPRATRSGLND